jgi:hypothetical protein
VRNFAATAALLAPPAHSRTIRARKATDRALRDGLAMHSNSARCAWFTDNSRFFGRLRRGSLPTLDSLSRICDLFMTQETREVTADIQNACLKENGFNNSRTKQCVPLAY